MIIYISSICDLPLSMAGTLPLGERLAGLALFSSNDQDPYVKHTVDDVESIEDFSVKPTDNLIIVGQTDDDCSRLDIYGLRTSVPALLMFLDGTRFIIYDVLFQAMTRHATMSLFIMTLCYPHIHCVLNGSTLIPVRVRSLQYKD